MASSRRQRRPHGHPAKVAERRARRGDAQSSPQAQLRRLALTACRDAAGIETGFEAELWASEVLGMWWEPGIDPLDPDFEPEARRAFVEEMARIGDAGALAGLIALGRVAETDVGPLALESAKRLTASGIKPPAWAEAIGHLDIRRAAVLRDAVFDDGATIFLESAHPGEQSHALGVYIDNNLGVMATDVVIVPSIAEVGRALEAEDTDDLELVIEPIDIAEAGARIRAALELTDMSFDPAVSEDYGALRSLVLLRIDEVPYAETEPVPEVDPEERGRLHREFLASREAGGMSAESVEADVVRAAIDFCTDYVDGRPLRWSPALVELFMTGWLPRKVIADADYFDAVPEALGAWVRYAGRQRNIPGWAIERTIEAIADCADEMSGEASSGVARGPAGDFIAAAQAAGVDLSDERALAGFVAGWNARSDRA
jgi:hypothetical protein